MAVTVEEGVARVRDVRLTEVQVGALLELVQVVGQRHPGEGVSVLRAQLVDVADPAIH